MADSKTATERLREMLDARGEGYVCDEYTVTWSYYTDPHTATESMDGTLIVTGFTPEQAIAATLGSDVHAGRLAERLHDLAEEMRNMGASTMTPHELLAFFAREIDKVADSLVFAATLGSEECEIVLGEDEMGCTAMVCSKCGKPVDDLGSPNFCPNCGKAVKR